MCRSTEALLHQMSDGNTTSLTPAALPLRMGLQYHLDLVLGAGEENRPLAMLAIEL
jgi:hypothetical protein